MHRIQNSCTSTTLAPKRSLFRVCCCQATTHSNTRQHSPASCGASARVLRHLAHVRRLAGATTSDASRSPSHTLSALHAVISRYIHLARAEARLRVPVLAVHVDAEALGVGEHVLQQLPLLGPRRLVGKLDGRIDDLRDVVVDRLEVVVRQQRVRLAELAERGQRVALLQSLERVSAQRLP